MAIYTVALRGGFSDRSGIKTENTTIQTVDFDNRTRVALNNATSVIFTERYPYLYATYNDDVQELVKGFWTNVYSRPINWKEYYYAQDLLSAIQDTLMTDTYDAVLSVVEYIVRVADDKVGRTFLHHGKRYTAAQFYNNVFEREYVGYRIIDKLVTPITDSTEAEEVEVAATSPYTDVRQHIDKALRFLSDRDAPDYANSIKESISAVERMCSIILGKATTLGDALKHLEDSGVKIHPALKRAFSQLYGYTSDASGIRHSGELGGKDSTFEEAKFMLVSCCAFINYLTGVMAKRP